MKKITLASYIILYLLPVMLFSTKKSLAQQENLIWIRPQNPADAPLWGIRNGITVSLWPAAAELTKSDGGPRGLLRIGYNYMGTDFLINFIAIEPLVDDDMEFSEVSPSAVDGKWGKFIWAADDSVSNNRFTRKANTRGTITHPDTLHPAVEELSFYLFMEPFTDGARPYIRVSIRSNAPGELRFQVFNQKGSALMQRCTLTATMGNYSRLRLLYLRNTFVDAGKLFAGYNDIDFVEKQAYGYSDMLRTKKGDYVAVAESDEDFAQLAGWPQQPVYQEKNSWRYRPFYKLTQYWRKPASDADSSLTVRVNGRVKYWSGGSNNPSDYINIPGGAAFENFELRDHYHVGETFIFGLSRLSARQLIDSL